MPEQAETINDKVKNAGEQFEVAGNQVVQRVRELIDEGNVRRLVFRTPDDRVVLEMTLTTGAVVGGVMALGAWWLLPLGALATAMTRIRVEVIREESEPTVVEGTATPVEESRPSSTGKQKVRIEVEQ